MNESKIQLSSEGLVIQSQTLTTWSWKNSGEKSIPREQPRQNKEMKIANLVLLCLFVGDNDKCNISHGP